GQSCATLRWLNWSRSRSQATASRRHWVQVRRDRGGAASAGAARVVSGIAAGDSTGRRRATVSLEIPLADPALELQPDGADGFADWCEEIQTGRLTAPRDPRDRDADHVPGAVDQGAAAVSRLERDVALDEALALLGAVAADDAARHRAAERKRRADRVHLGADGKIDGRYRQRAG